MPYLLHDSQLTPEQRAVVELRPEQDHVIAGPPGSGKTQVLLHRARWLASNYKVDPANYRIFVYTNVLSYFLKQALQVLDIPESTVQTFDDWCGDYWDSHRMGTRPRDATGKKTDYQAVRASVLKHVEDHGVIEKPPLHFALVDEGQDLDDVSFRLLRRIARHVTVVADGRQQIFENGSSLERICLSLRLHGQIATFMSGARNSPTVGKLASYFGASFDAKNWSVDRETPAYYIASDWDDEISMLATTLRERRLLNQRCGILVPTRKDLFSVRTKLEALGIATETAMPPSAGGGTLDFENTTPKISTYHSAKGLTFDCVLLPKLVARNWQNVGGAQRHKLLLVGITRATRWVYLSTVSGYEMEETAILRTAAANGDLFIRNQASVPPRLSAQPAPPAHGAPGDDLDFL